MDELNIHSRSAGTADDILILEFDGPLNATTVRSFPDVIHTLSLSVPSKIIARLQRVSEVDRFGLGLLAGWLEFLRARGSDIKWVVPNDWIERSDLQDTLTVLQPAYLKEEDAVMAFGRPGQGRQAYRFVLTPASAEIVCGVPFRLRIEALGRDDDLLVDYTGLPHLVVDTGLVSPPLTPGFHDGVWEGEVVVTGPGAVRVQARDGEAMGEVTVNVRNDLQLAVFPVELTCPGCHRTNIAGKSDVFRCIQCNSIYFVDPYAHVIPLKPSNTGEGGFVKRIEFSMPSDVNYLNHVRNFIVGIASEEKILDEKIAQIEMSLDEALANVVEHAYMYDAYQQIRIEIALYSDRLEILIKDTGRSFDHENLPLPDLKKHIEERKVGGLGRYLIKTLMDEVEYRSDRHTNALRMVKRF